jgi:hypothetical protein
MTYCFVVFSLKQLGQVQKLQRLSLDHFFEPEQPDVGCKIIIFFLDSSDNQSKISLDLF